MPILKIIDSKYHIDNEGPMAQTRIVKTGNNEPIPDDEPVVLFRARDNLALYTLRIYKILCFVAGCTTYQVEAVQALIEKFESFSFKNEHRMKQPGCTLGK